jgi:hypothetical protein
MPQPPYSPDFGIYGIFLLQKVKSAVKRHHFKSTEIRMAVTQTLSDIPQTAFQECYKRWQHHLKMCVQAQGVYFEGDYVVVDE